MHGTDGVSYKAVLKDAAGATIWTQDLLYSVDSIVASTLKQDLVNTTDAAKGSAFIGVFLSATGYIGRLLSAWIADRPYYAGDFGASNDGVTEARPGIVLADTNGPFTLGAGTYLVSTNLTIANKVTFNTGSKFSIAAGVTITFSGLIEAGEEQIFSGLGTVVLADSRTRTRVIVDWWGTTADYAPNVNGGTDDSGAFTSAIASLNSLSGEVFALKETYFLGTTPITLQASDQLVTAFSGNRTYLGYNGTGGTVVSAPGSTGTVLARCEVKGFLIQVYAVGGYGVDITGFSYGEFDNVIDVRSTSTDGTAIYGTGNTDGSGPYYNNIGGYAIGASAVGQTFCRFVANDATAFLGSGPNANNFSNMKRVAAFGIGMDIQGGNGNLGANIQFELIKTAIFRFNSRTVDASGTATSGTRNSVTDTGAAFVTAQATTGSIKITGGTGSGQSSRILSATSTVINTVNIFEVVPDATSTYEVTYGKAVNNIFTNIRVEGAGTAKFAEFAAGSYGNRLKAAEIGSIGATYYTKEINENSNVLDSHDGLIPFHFTTSNAAAGSTIELDPGGATFNGGYVPGFSGFVESVVVSASGRSGSSLGTGTVAVYRAGTACTLAPVINADGTYNLSVASLLSYVTSSNDRIKPGENLRVTFTTDGSWNTTTSDIAVTVYVRKT